MVRLHYVLTANSTVVNILNLRNRKTPAGGQTVGQLSLDGGAADTGSIKVFVCFFVDLQICANTLNR